MFREALVTTLNKSSLGRRHAVGPPQPRMAIAAWRWGLKGLPPQKSHQSGLSAPPMPRSALSPTLAVGVISFPMGCTQILGFLWPENRKQLSQAQPTAQSPPQGACSACSQPPRLPAARLASELEVLGFNLRGNPCSHCLLPLELTQSPGTSPSPCRLNFTSISFNYS